MATTASTSGVRFATCSGPAPGRTGRGESFWHGSATGCDAAVHGHGAAIDERLVVEHRGRWGTQSCALVGLGAADLREPLLVIVGCLAQCEPTSVVCKSENPP